MESTFLGIEIGKRSLIAHQKGLNVIGQNLSNADNPAYSRQRIIIDTVEPLYRPDLNRPERAGRVGQGIEVAEIRRERDIYLDARIQQQTSTLSYWQQKEFHISDIENIQNALGEGNLQSKLDVFWQGWQELSKNASEPALREELLQNSLSLTDSFRSSNRKFNDLRREINQKISSEMVEVNNLIRQIARFNQQIRNSQILGDNPNDLLDKRDFMVEELAQKIDATVSLNDDDEFMVHSGARILIQGHKFQTLATENDTENGGLLKIVWENTRDDYRTKGGSIAAHLEARDKILTQEIRNLDVLATNLMFAVNDIHNKGFNQYGKITGDFFTFVPRSADSNGVNDSNNNGTIDSTAIYQIRGAAVLNGQDIVGSTGTISLIDTNSPNRDALVNVNYSLTDSIDAVIERLNLSQDSVNFKLDQDGRLLAKTRSNDRPYPFSLEFLSDSGDFLTGISRMLNQPGTTFSANNTNAINTLHPEATFNLSPLQSVSAYLNINPLIKADSNLIAARGSINLGTTESPSLTSAEVGFLPKGINDGSIAQEISEVRYKQILVDNQKTFNEFYLETIANLSTELSNAKLESERHDAIQLGLSEVRQSISGVNIDEELSQMIVFQNGYQAGARIVKMMDEVLDIIMQL